MKIAGTAMTMQSQHYAATQTHENESLKAWTGPRRPDFEGTRARAPEPPPVQISSAALTASSEADAVANAADAATDDPRLQLLIAVLEWMTGKRIKLVDTSQLQTTDVPAPQAPPAADQARSAGFGVEYEYHASRQEVEQTNFSVQGKAITADGREIAFSLDVGMSRSYSETVDVSFRAGDGVRQRPRAGNGARKDPLVVNFGPGAAQLLQQRMKFDLDANGKTEEIALLGSGSGYLALDLNRDGKINSGAELFGPATGSGFAELAKYDQDGNGWIDEGDPIFGQLRVWTPAAQGNGQLSSLADHGVGALFLGHQSTPFELRGQANDDLGAVRDSGLYLTESGVAGSIQEIDLTV